MKRFIMFWLVLFSLVGSAQQSQVVNSKPSHVTLFLTGAQVSRTAQSTLQAGITELTFSDLSVNLDPNSIRVTGEGDFTIISVKSKVNYLKTRKTIQDEEQLRTRKKTIENNLEDITVKEEVIATEENLLKANQKVGLADKGTTSSELKATADFFRARFTELSTTSLDLSRKKEVLKEELETIDNQLKEASALDVKSTGEIIVQVMAESAVSAKFKLVYFVRTALWKPEFDLRLESVSRPIELSRRAIISQNSGEEWNNIKLTLSTGNPIESGTEPQLFPWYLGGYSYPVQNKSDDSRRNQAVIDKPNVGYLFNGRVTGRVYSLDDGFGMPGVTVLVTGTNTGTMTDMNGDYKLDIKSGTEISYSFVGMQTVTTRIDNPVINIGMTSSSVLIEGVVVTALGIEKKRAGSSRIEETQESHNLEIISNDQELNTSVKEYSIAMPMSLPPDGKEYSLIIGEETIPAEYEFHATPKLDRDAFLMAKVNNWQDYDLLDASAGIFYEGTFTGRTNLTANVATDTLNISLGRDKSIIVERKKIKDYSSSQLIGPNRTVQRTWEISIRNNKKQAIRLILQDQYPVSREKEIEVELTDAGGAKVNQENGFLFWDLTIDPGQLSKIKFTYSIKYPKERILKLE